MDKATYLRQKAQAAEKTFSAVSREEKPVRAVSATGSERKRLTAIPVSEKATKNTATNPAPVNPPPPAPPKEKRPIKVIDRNADPLSDVFFQVVSKGKNEGKTFTSTNKGMVYFPGDFTPETLLEVSRVGYPVQRFFAADIVSPFVLGGFAQKPTAAAPQPEGKPTSGTMTKTITVTDASGNPVEGAHVMTSEGENTITDSNGKATVTVTSPSTWVDIEAVAGETTSYAFFDLPETVGLVANQLGEVVVTAKKKKLPWGWIAAGTAALFLMLKGGNDKPGMGKPKKITL